MAANDNRPGGTDGKGARKGACPICGKPREEAYRPFCSKRCADVDLGRWMTGVYAVPATEEEPDGEDFAQVPAPGDDER